MRSGPTFHVPHWALPALAALGLSAGLVMRWLHSPLSVWAWAGTTGLALAAAGMSMAKKLRARELSVDLLALLAMAGTLATGEFLAGAVIAVMVTGGSALEHYAGARARRELTALLRRAPRIAHRTLGARLLDVNLSEVRVGDVILVKSGEVVPADGWLVTAGAVLDVSLLTGESRPENLLAGGQIRSGVANAGAPFEVQVTRPPAQSTYEGILRLVRSAEDAKAPMVRLADRYAWIFLLGVLAVCGATWLVTGSASRVVAVLVVATPCPLILAAPAAFMAGISRAARRGIIVKGGAALEALASTRVVLLDKTGTITSGRPRVTDVVAFGGRSTNELLSAAAALEQVSTHPFAPVILAEAGARHLPVTFPSGVQEQQGSGIHGVVNGHRVSLGQLAWVEKQPSAEGLAVQARAAIEGASCVFVALDGRLAGALILQDPIRGEAPRIIHLLRKRGIERIHMVTGDHPDVAELVGDAVGVDHVFAERTPAEKVDAVRRAQEDGVTLMVGDGMNDAPALALADVGVAMGARGANAAAEAADVVLTADRLERLVDALDIARATRRIALQSVLVGMGLSVMAMAVAAWGLLPAVAGAVLQEAIDLAVILNALRALGLRDGSAHRLPAQATLGRELESRHATLQEGIEKLGAIASALDTSSHGAVSAQELKQAAKFLSEELLPHEREEQRQAFPVIARIEPGEDPTGPLIATHREIARLSRLFSRLVQLVPNEGPRPEQVRDLRRILFGLHAILKLHFAQEDELYALLSGGG